MLSVHIVWACGYRNRLYKWACNFRVVFALTPRRISLYVFATFGEIQKQTVKMSKNQRLYDKWCGELQEGWAWRFLETWMWRWTSCTTYGNHLRILDPYRESLEMVVQKQWRLTKIAICLCITMRVNKIATALQSFRDEFQGLVLIEGYMAEACLQ